MELPGHSQISLTMNTYAHVMPCLMKDAYQEMDALFGGEAAAPSAAQSWAAAHKLGCQSWAVKPAQGASSAPIPRYYRPKCR